MEDHELNEWGAYTEVSQYVYNEYQEAIIDGESFLQEWDNIYNLWFVSLLWDV